jgi:hypothetical protein
LQPVQDNGYTSNRKSGAIGSIETQNSKFSEVGSSIQKLTGPGKWKKSIDETTGVGTIEMSPTNVPTTDRRLMQLDSVGESIMEHGISVDQDGGEFYSSSVFKEDSRM